MPVKLLAAKAKERKARERMMLVVSIISVTVAMSKLEHKKKVNCLSHSKERENGMTSKYATSLLYLFVRFITTRYSSNEYIISSRLKCGLVATKHQIRVSMEHWAVRVRRFSVPISPPGVSAVEFDVPLLNVRAPNTLQSHQT